MSSLVKHEVSVYTAKETNGILAELYSSKNQQGLIVALPASVELVSTLMFNMMHPEVMELTSNEKKHMVVAPIQGCTLVTTRRRLSVWQTLFRKSQDYLQTENTTQLQRPPFTLLTYDTCGSLFHYPTSQQSEMGKHKLEYAPHAILFDEAEYLNTWLKQNTKIVEMLRQRFTKIIMFTTNVPFSDLHHLVRLTVYNDKNCLFPMSTSAVHDRYEVEYTRIPKKIHELFI